MDGFGLICERSGYILKMMGDADATNAQQSGFDRHRPIEDDGFGMRRRDDVAIRLKLLVASLHLAAHLDPQWRHFE
jgi:hypothetical protein